MSNFGILIDTAPVLRALSKLLKRDPVRRSQLLIAKHIIHEMEESPPQKYVSRKAAYGSVFFSETQQKAFFAMLSSGEISVPRRRTGALGRSYYLREQNGEVWIGNRKRYARHVVDKIRQSRMMKRIGWKTLQAVVIRELRAMRKIIREELRKDMK